MKKNYFCMLGAMLICAATVFTGCGNADDPAPRICPRRLLVNG